MQQLRNHQDKNVVKKVKQKKRSARIKKEETIHRVINLKQQSHCPPIRRAAHTHQTKAH